MAKRGRPQKYLNIDFILKEYFDNEKSLGEIGRYLGVSRQIIKLRILKSGNELRSHFTLRYLKNRSETQKSLWKNESYRKNQVKKHTGKKSSDLTRLKQSISIKKNLPKTIFKKGHISWIKGLKKAEDIRLANLIEKSVQTRIKNGNYVHTEQQKKKTSIKLTSVPKSPKHIENVRQANIGKKRTEETKRKLRKSRAKQIMPLKDTKIELKIQDFLTALKIEFFTHKYMNIKHAYQCDILIPEQFGIPKKTIIECDGDFFHCNPNKYSANFVIFPNNKNPKTAKDVWEKDDARTKELIEKGFRVIRLWGSEIHKMELEDFEQKLDSIKL